MLDFLYNENGINRTFLDQVQAPDGSMRVWGFTLDPVVHVTQEGPVDFYVTGGGGIYHRTVEYTQPVVSPGSLLRSLVWLLSGSRSAPTR